MIPKFEIERKIVIKNAGPFVFDRLNDFTYDHVGEPTATFITGDPVTFEVDYPGITWRNGAKLNPKVLVSVTRDDKELVILRTVTHPMYFILLIIILLSFCANVLRNPSLFQFVGCSVVIVVFFLWDRISKWGAIRRVEALLES